MLRTVAPIGFVFLWSTGWIVARYVADFADPFLFLALRMALAGLCLAAMAVLAGAPWPQGWRERFHAGMSGVLLHTGYLGGVWWAIEHGLSATLSGLLAALQPILSAILAPWLLRERIGPVRGFGVALGFIGLCLVLAPRLAALAEGERPAGLPLLVNVVAMVSATAGTFYQKACVQAKDLRTTAVWQYVGAFLTLIPLALLLGDLHFQSSVFAWAVMGWSVVGISIGAIALLLLLIREGEVSRSSQLFFLVPPVTALQAMILFGDRLGAVQWVGMAVTCAGVALAMRRA